MHSRKASLRNLEKANAHWRAPRPWRCAQEGRLIKRLAWQWFVGVEPRCSLRGLALRLGVSLMYLQRLMQQFKVNPESDLGAPFPATAKSAFRPAGKCKSRTSGFWSCLGNCKTRKFRASGCGSLWFDIGSHMAFDWGLTFFYSCDRASVHGYLFNASLHGNKWFTGGSAGPEGNIFNVFLVAAGILLLSKVKPNTRPSPSGRYPFGHRS
jgi:hypothetical protein